MTNYSMLLPSMTSKMFIYNRHLPDTILNDVDGDVAIYSPINTTFYLTKANRVLILSLASIFGTLMNGFFVSTFVIEDKLRRLGNIFMACTGISDIIITFGALPLCSFLVFYRDWGSLISCKTIQVAVQASTYCYNVFFALTTVETYFRFNPYREAYRWFLSTRIDVITCLIFLSGTILSVAGVYFELDVDFCGREHTGNLMFRLITTIFFLIVPGLVALICSLTSMIMVRRKAQRIAKYRRSRQFRHDKMTTTLNFFGYMAFVLFWLPYFIIANQHPNASDDSFYNSSYIGVSRAVFSGFLYGIIHPVFRNIYGVIFYYCFYRSELKTPRINRRRRLLNARNRSSGQTGVQAEEESVARYRHSHCTCETQNL